MTDTTSSEFFEGKYRSAANGDPWNFAGSDYELFRYGRIINALGREHFAHAFEPGCSVGVLTAQLAEHCAHVDACDLSATAVKTAQQRCSALHNVTISCGALQSGLPWDRYDLLVLCEIGYYFQSVPWRTLVEEIVNAMHPGAVLLASHWLGQSNDHLQSGDEVHAAFEHAELQLTLRERHAEFRIDRLNRR